MKRIRVVVLTQVRRGMASICLPALLARPEVHLVGVILADSARTSILRWVKRRLKKTLQIGFFGALNGIRMRKWYQSQYDDVGELCTQYAIPFVNGIAQNSSELAKIITDYHVDLGVSLGNSYIAPQIFSLPRLGMINVHSEILPAYQNAQSIIWPIYCHDPYSGFTVHEIERRIDSGRILFQCKYPLRFFRNLEKTVRENKKEIEKNIPTAVADVCANIDEYRQNAHEQKGGRTYTTPTFFQFLRMVNNNRYFYGIQRNEG